MTRLLPIALAALLALPTAAAQPAGAQEDPQTRAAKKHFYRGEKLFALGRFAPALEAYEAAFELDPIPHFLFNIGQCHRNLGNLDQAIFSFRKYLKLWPDAPNRVAVETLIAELREQRRAEKDAARDRRLGLRGPQGPGDGDRRTRGGVHTQWWFWTGVGVVAVAAGVTVAVAAGGGGSSIPDSDLDNIDFGR